MGEGLIVRRGGTGGIDLSLLDVTKVFYGTVRFTSTPTNTNSPLSCTMETGMLGKDIVAIIINPQTIITDYYGSYTYLQSCIFRKDATIYSRLYGIWEGNNINGVCYTDARIAISETTSKYGEVISGITSGGRITFYSHLNHSVYKANTTYDVWVLGK